MKTLKKVHEINQASGMLLISCGEQCPSLGNCPNLNCICYTGWSGEGNSSIEEETIIF